MEMEMTTPTTMLPDDVALEILARLGDVATLFRCATACKGWRRLVAEPSFLARIRWPPSLVGFFTQRLVAAEFPGTSTSTDASSQLAFVPLLLSGRQSPLGTRRRRLSSSLLPSPTTSEAGAAAVVIDRALPLDTRGGLLVVRLFPHDLATKPNVVRLAVCNMLAGGRWDDWLPELECSNTQFRHPNNPYSCDIIPSDGAGFNYRVLMIGRDKRRPQYNLHVFVSGEARWRAPIRCLDMMEHRIFSMEAERRAVLCGRGYAHWLFASQSSHFHVLSYNLHTGHVSSTKLLTPTKVLPASYMDHVAFPGVRLTTTAGGSGKLLALRVYSGGRLEIWTREEDGDANKWERTRVIDHRLTQLIQMLERPYCFWEAEMSDTLLVKDYAAWRFYKASLHNGTLEEVTNQFPVNHLDTIMPMEIDWPTLFMSRLGGP